MLSAKEQDEIQIEMAHYPDKQSVCIDAMKIVQRHRGWVSDDSLVDIADYLEMSVDDLDGIATFYNLIFRKPVGRHVITVCDSVSCWMMGSNDICARLSSQLGIQFGETTTDNRFTLLPNVCLGACDHAPVMMIDENLHCDLAPPKLDRILDEYK